jgi:hypothetical protein
VGNSHSGSTLLGFLLSANPDIINLGELKSRTWLNERFCTCGQTAETCPLYGGNFETFNELKQNIIVEGRKISPLQFIFRKRINPGRKNIDLLRQWYSSLSERVRQVYPNAKYMTDGSKSIWLLNDWLYVIPAHDIRIIWLKRQVRANVSSFVKRGFPFLSSLLIILLNNYITGRFLRKNNLEYLEVSYDRFYAAFAEEAQAMSTFLGTDVPPTYASHQNHHVISGNARTRQVFATQFKGLHKDEEWTRVLSPLQKRIVSWIS